MISERNKVMVLPDNTIIVALSGQAGNNWAYAATFCPTDITALSEQQQLDFKRSNPNYAVTEVGGMYYIITMINLFQMAVDEPTENNLVRLFLTAADHWHDHIKVLFN